MNEVRASRTIGVRSIGFTFYYSGMDQKLIDTLRFDSNFEAELTKIMLPISQNKSISLLVTKHDRKAKHPEGVTLVSYNRFSVDISYFEAGLSGLGAVYIQVNCGGNTGAAEELFTKLKAAGVRGGDIGCTAFADPSFTVKRNLAGALRSRTQDKSTNPIKLAKAIPIVYVRPSPEKKGASPVAGKQSLEDAIKQIARILALGKESKSELLSGRASTKTINTLVGDLAQKGYYHLANTLTRALL